MKALRMGCFFDVLGTIWGLMNKKSVPELERLISCFLRFVSVGSLSEFMYLSQQNIWKYANADPSYSCQQDYSFVKSMYGKLYALNGDAVVSMAMIGLKYANNSAGAFCLSNLSGSKLISLFQ